jgi:hypothetical protein
MLSAQRIIYLPSVSWSNGCQTLTIFQTIDQPVILETSHLTKLANSKTPN